MDESTINIIKEYFAKYKSKTIPPAKIQCFLKNNKDIECYLNNVLKEHCEYEKISFLIKSIVCDIKLHECKICGKIIPYSKNKNIYCSKGCENLDTDHLEKQQKEREITNLKKFGVKNSWSSEIVKSKIRNTNLEKYGVENPQQNLKIKNKSVKTFKKNFGKESKNHETYIQRIKNDCIEKYGVDSTNKLESVKNKIKKSFKSKYGHESFHYKNGWTIINTWKDYVIPMFSENEYKGYKNEYDWKCTKCGKIFKQKIYGTNHLKEISEYIPRCFSCYPINTPTSKLENEVLSFCKSWFSNCEKEKSKQFIYPFELDIVIPEIKLAIEFNGSYWHSMKEVGYHLNKTRLCNEKGYRLIHIWEDEWDCRKEEIKKKLIDIFEGREDLNFTDTEIRLDRSWYNNIEIPGYTLKEESCPEIVIRNGFEVENCGCLVYIKNI